MPPEVAKAFARLLAAEPAAKAWLEGVVDGTTGPEMSDAALRWHEGKRQFASMILLAAERARKGEV